MSRRESLLREMGLAPLWRLRGAVGVPPEEAGPIEAMAPEAAPDAETAVALPVQRAPVMPPSPSPVPTVVAPAGSGPAGDVSALGWDELEARIRDCTSCRLCERRTRAVPGVGDRDADWLFVGEGPGVDEDLRGEPFVGQAGKLLDAMLAAIGLERGQRVYIANAVKCRPPGNRTPDAGEMAVCAPYLDRQIELIRPRIIVALGRPAAQTLLGTEVKIASARGQLFERKGIPVVVTYHPAYLLRTPQDKAKAWEDLCFARDSVV